MLTTIWHSELASDSFCKLKDLDIRDCDNLVNIFVPSIMGKLSALDTLSIKMCKSLQLIFAVEGAGVKDIIQDTSTATQLTSISCVNLSSVEIDSCESLKNVFPAWVARNLQQLKTLTVTTCGVEQIIAKEDGLQTTPKFVFPKVTTVFLYELARLTNLYPEMHASYWPSLNHLRVLKCEKVNIFGMEISSFQADCEPEHLCNLIQRSLFIIDKDSFPNLEWLSVEAKEFWNGSFPAGLFSKLKSLDMACLASTSVTFLDRPLIVNHEETIFGTSTSTAGGLGTQLQQQYLHLRELRLVRMKKLMHLGYKQDEEDNSQSAPSCPNIPNLEILFVIGCDSLRNLRSSAISFKYLTTLKVIHCHEMEYLVTPSIARDLMHLTKLEVQKCPRLVAIVGSSQVANWGSEIAFRKLKHLKLSYLPRLQGFCSENCMVKLPPFETLRMSNRLKLKLFPRDETLQVTEEEDTDFEESEALTTNSQLLLQSVASTS